MKYNGRKLYPNSQRSSNYILAKRGGIRMS